MLNWLRTIFSAEAERKAVAAEAENKRLTGELEFWKGQCELLAKQKDLADARFLREVNSNRKREDAMSDIIRKLVRSPERLPAREVEDLPADANEITQPALFIDEQAVVNLANQFREDARGRGINYTSEDFELLCGRIRANYDEYFTN